MKKTMLIVLAVLATLIAAAPAKASTEFPVVQEAALSVTTNTDIDEVAELIVPAATAAADFPNKCGSVTVTNTLATGDVVYIAYLSNALTASATALASVPSWGWPLYPVATSGATSKTIEFLDSAGKRMFVNPRKIVAAAGGNGSKVALACDGIR